jgi:hypothetical protein
MARRARCDPLPQAPPRSRATRQAHCRYHHGRGRGWQRPSSVGRTRGPRWMRRDGPNNPGRSVLDELVREYVLDTDDAVLLLLRVHLSVEKGLIQAVALNVHRPEFIEAANLRFHQLLHLAKAWFYEDRDEAAWDALQALNILRNRLAHHLEPGDLKPLLQRILQHHSDELALGSLEQENALRIVIFATGMMTHFVSRLGRGANER